MPADSSHDHDRVSALLARYLSGDATDAERAELLRRLPHADQIRGVLDAHADVDAVSAWEMARARITEPMSHRAHRTHARAWPRGFWRGGWGRTTGIVSAALAVCGVIFVLNHAPRPTADIREYSTRTGQSAVVTLATGIRVTLAPQTKLTVATTSAGIDATLIGEAYFVAPHQLARPFAVHTGNVATRVLGTSFNVARYANDSVTRVFVTEGKVATGVLRPSIITAGTLAAITDSVVTTTEVSDAQTRIGWIGGRLVFQNAPISDVLAAIHRWYGVDIRLADSTLASQRLTTELDVRRSPHELMAVLEAALEIHVTMVGDTLILGAHRPTPHRAPERRTTGTTFSTETEMGR